MKRDAQSAMACDMALRQKFLEAGQKAEAILKRKPTSEGEGNGQLKNKSFEGEEKNEGDKGKERKRRRRRDEKGKEKLTESEEERLREQEREEEEIWMLALAANSLEEEEEERADEDLRQRKLEVEAEQAATKKRKQDDAAMERAREELQQPQVQCNREAELERRIKEDADTIQRLKQHLEEARAAAAAAAAATTGAPEEAQRERCGEVLETEAEEAQTVAREEAAVAETTLEAGNVGGVEGGSEMPMVWDPEVYVVGEQPSFNDCLLSDFISDATASTLLPSNTSNTSYTSFLSSSSTSSSLHASSPTPAHVPLGIRPAPPQAWGIGHFSVGHTNSWPTSPITASPSSNLPPSSRRPQPYVHYSPPPPQHQPALSRKSVSVLLPLLAPPPHSDQTEWRRVRFPLTDDREVVKRLKRRALAHLIAWLSRATGHIPSNQEEAAEAARAAAEAADQEHKDWELCAVTSPAPTRLSARVPVLDVFQRLGPDTLLSLQRK